MKTDSDGHFTILKGRIHQEDINIVNIYAPNIGAPKYIGKVLENFKKDIDSNTIIVGDFNTLLSKMDRSSEQNINKDIVGRGQWGEGIIGTTIKDTWTKSRGRVEMGEGGGFS